MYIIISGNPVDGFAYKGPYPDHQDALAAAEGRGGHWWIAPIQSAEPCTDDHEEYAKSVIKAAVQAGIPAYELRDAITQMYGDELNSE
jgi:hypothetical protein